MISLPATFLMFIWFASMQLYHNKCAIHAIQQ